MMLMVGVELIVRMMVMVIVMVMIVMCGVCVQMKRGRMGLGERCWRVGYRIGLQPTIVRIFRLWFGRRIREQGKV